jgi:hypothetical protein
MGTVGGSGTGAGPSNWLAKPLFTLNESTRNMVSVKIFFVIG